MGLSLTGAERTTKSMFKTLLLDFYVIRVKIVFGSLSKISKSHLIPIW